MPGLVPGIHVFDALRIGKKDVDGRDEPGHDDYGHDLGLAGNIGRLQWLAAAYQV